MAIQKSSSLLSSHSSTSLICISILLGVLFWTYPDVLLSSVDTTEKKAGSLLPSLGTVQTEAGSLQDSTDPPWNVTLVGRDEYSCASDKPCKNGACCGKDGYCGYGPTYCGDGCVSNCGAVAECGQYAKQKGKECPLNTCCSEFGFCGTTEDFCGKKCQSNCVLHPKPPGGGASRKILDNKVIGYYESWAARKDCHKVGPKDLPLDALTHLNYAFAFIDPSTYNIVTMDADTPESLFKDTADVKSIKPDLKVWVSVGGWTFSDNDTATQPLFGEIAADESKRQKFADNTVRFMKQYGFDGLDIDWEYPGAPDRGGKPEDKDNFVKLTETLRKTFDGSGSKFGLTFTAPSSYWYLRWFDLPGLVKNVDWINLMTYDLHGVWDATNPIGNIVQGHTNLTEIKLAVELFWRVDVPPAKVVMGFGFYGRAFTLADSGCTKPGCEFKGASSPGKCTATGGYLAHYEIMDILNGAGSKTKRAKIEPTYDEENAVNYFTFDNDQWVSYDDEKTLKQKVDWANDAGLGGGLIWASDQDDDKFSAHKSLVGRDVKSNKDLEKIDKALSAPKAVIDDLAGSNGQNCFAYKDKCVKLDDNDAMAKACGTGFTPVGWDDAGCGKKSCHCGKPICCPVDQAPKDCNWRGQGNGRGTKTDCTAQCAPGETNIKGIGSSWGGGFLNDGDTDKCGRGYKVFCCPNPDFPQVTKGCELTGCRKDCPSGKKKIFDKADDCTIGYKTYCCPDPPELSDCRWEGGSRGNECVNAKCKDTEVEVAQDAWGGYSGFENGGYCNWGRKRVACCTVKKAPPKPAYCKVNLCKALPGWCPEEGDDVGDPGKKRSIDGPTAVSKDDTPTLVRRGSKETYTARIGNANLEIIARAYPSIGRLFGGVNAARILHRFFRLIQGYCVGPAIAVTSVPSSPGKDDVAGFHTEHPIDRQVMKSFAESSAAGTLQSGGSPNLAAIPQSFWTQQWAATNAALGNRPPIGWNRGPTPNTPNGRVMDSFGTSDYPDPFMAVDAQINAAKGHIFGLEDPQQPRKIDDLAESSVRGGGQDDIDELLSVIRSAIATFEYLRTTEAAARFNMVRNQVRTQLGYIEQDVNVANLVRWWEVWSNDYFSEVERVAQDWVRDAIRRAAAPWTRPENRNNQMYEQVIGALEQMLEEVAGMRLPPNNQGAIPPPQPPGGGGGGVGGGGGS